MKTTLKIIAIIILIGILVFAGYEGYLLYQEWKEDQESSELKLMETLKANEGMIIRLTSELAETQKKVIGETLKETTIIKEEAPTYEAKKEELIELRKEPEANKEKIEVARIEFEERINEFQASPDKILINTGEEKIVIYEDDQGNLVSLESGITITRHRKIEEVIDELTAGAEIQKEEEKKYAMAFSMVYDMDQKNYSPGLSYQLWDWKKISLNITGYDFENIKAGLDLSYNVNENIVIGAGMRLFEWEGYQFNIDKYYLKAGVEFTF